MTTKGERGSTILIPYTTFPNSGSEDVWFHIVYCAEDDLYYVFRAVVERGLGDYEKISCPTCGGEVRKYGGTDDSHISATNVPEAVACLKVSSSKTLKLAVLEFVTEDEIKSLSEHLVKLPTLKQFSRLEKISDLLSFRQVQKFLRKKRSSSYSYIDLSKSRKNEEKLLEDDTRSEEPNLVRPSEVVAANPRLSERYLERLREEWLSLQQSIELTERGKKPQNSKKKSSANQKPKWFTTALAKRSGTNLLKATSVFFEKPIHSKGVWVTSLKLLAQEKRYLRVLLTEKKFEL